MIFKKIGLGATYQVGPSTWLKPNVVEVELEPGDTVADALDNCKAKIEQWMLENYPGAQLSGEPEELPIIQQNR